MKINDQSLLFKHEIIDPTTNNFQFCLATERCCEMYVRKKNRLIFSKAIFFLN